MGGQDATPSQCKPAGAFFSKTYPSFLTVKEGSTSSPQAPSSSEGGGCNRSCSELSFRKPTSPPLPLREGPPLISVFSPQGRRGNRPTRCSNRYAIRLADHQRSAPGFCAEWDRMDMGLLMGCLRLHDICYERSAPGVGKIALGRARHLAHP